MNKVGRIGLPILGASALVIAMSSAALATTVTSGGLPYTGDVKATNLNNVTLSGTSSLGLIVNTCTTGVLDAHLPNPNGTGGSLTGVTLSGCTNNKGGTTTFSVTGLPYTGGTVFYGPVAGGRDGTIVIDAPNLNVNVQAVASLPSAGVPSLTCNYTLSTSADLVIDLYNSTNANRPVPANNNSQGALVGQALQRTGTDVRCPASASANGKFKILTNPGLANLALAP